MALKQIKVGGVYTLEGSKEIVEVLEPQTLTLEDDSFAGACE